MHMSPSAAEEQPARPIHLFLWVVVALAAGAIGALATSPGAWYAALDKPSWNPPSWVFGPVWTTLYVLMGIAAGLVWPLRQTRSGAVGFRLFGLQLVLNAAWSWLFFHWHRPDLALADLLVLWVAILGTIIAFRRIRPLAGALLVPYLAWVTFAGLLNASIASRNPGGMPVGPVGPASGVAAADCAPWDGAATSIYLSDSPAGAQLPPEAPYLQLVIYRGGGDLAGRRVTLGHQEDGSGIAVHCRAGGACSTADDGTVEFGPPDASGALTGAYHLVFADGPVSGVFHAVWSPRTALCG
jgi:translocator protein